MPVAMAKGVRRNEVASEEVRIYLGRSGTHDRVRMLLTGHDLELKMMISRKGQDVSDGSRTGGASLTIFGGPRGERTREGSSRSCCFRLRGETVTKARNWSVHIIR